MQSNMAVDAAISSSPRIRDAWGITAAIGSGENRKIRNPIMAFQNPATIQGNVIANNTISTMSIVLNPEATAPKQQARSIRPLNREQSSK